MVSSGMLRRVALLIVDVSEELSASIIRVIHDVTSQKTPFSIVTAMKTSNLTNCSSFADSFYPVNGSDAFLRNVGIHKLYRARQPEDCTLHSYRREDVKSLKTLMNIPVASTACEQFARCRGFQIILHFFFNKILIFL
jgi:hypothetical protein